MALIRNSHGKLARVPHGLSAFTELGVKLPLMTLANGQGFYIGTADAGLGGPVSRESVETWTTQEAAEGALRTGEWTQHHG